MSYSRAVFRATYSGKTHAQIEAQRDTIFQRLKDEGINGRFILGEQDYWMEIGGDSTDVDVELNTQVHDSFWATTNVVSNDKVGSPPFSALYGYFECEDPLCG